MRKKIPDVLVFESRLNDKLNKYKGYFYIEAFDFTPSAKSIQRVTEDVDKVLDGLDSVNDRPNKDLAQGLSALCAARLIGYFGLNKFNLKESALRDRITEYLHSSVFNLRSVESIRRPLIVASAQVLEWWESLKDYESDSNS